MSGFIKLHRGWANSDIFDRAGPYCHRAAWVWLLENAAWKECQRRDAHGNIVTVQRGQIHTSARALAAVWGWSKNKADRFLRDLKKCQMTDHQTDQHGVLITICNYDKYQARWDGDGPQNGTVTDQSRTTQEEDKELKEGKKKDYAFNGRTIRLNEVDLERWRARYSNLTDIEAELGSLDDWISGQDEKTRKGWFHIASGSLNKRHQAAGKSNDNDLMEGFVC